MNPPYFATNIWHHRISKNLYAKADLFNIQTEYLEIELLVLLWNCFTPVGMFIAETLLTLKAYNKLQQIGLIQKKYK